MEPLHLELELGSLLAGRPYLAALVRLTSRQQRFAALHTHLDFHELMYVVSGRGVHRLESEAIPLGAGDLVLVRPKDHHSFSCAGKDGITFVNVSFPSQPWRAFLELAPPRSPGCWEQPAVPPTVQIAPEERPAMAEAFWRALERFQGHPDFFDLTRLWSSALPALTEGRARSPVGQRREVEGTAVVAPDWLERAAAAIQQEANMCSGLHCLQQLAGVSSGHLRRAMRRYYDTTPERFVANVRVRHAATLLSTTVQSVTAIALRCGFSNQSYFTKEFRRMYGLSPRAYRLRASRAVAP